MAIETVAHNDLISEYMSIKAERLEHDRKSRALQVKEEVLKYAIVSAHKGGTLFVPEGVDFSYEEKSEPFVEDWPVFIQWIIDNDAPDLLQRRITVSAVWARMELGIDLPGVVVVLKPILHAELRKD
jgi:hypothetical protein